MTTHRNRWMVLALFLATLWASSARAGQVFAVTADTGVVEAIDASGVKAWPYGSPDMYVLENGLRFNVYFMDIRNNTHSGFALDAPTGADARARLTEVLEYVADILNERGTLDLLVKASGSIGGGFEVYGGTYFTTDTSSQAGAALYRLRTGEKQSASLPDLFLQVDFGSNFNLGTDTPGALELDCYSLLLHGLTHSLGAVSLMERTGASSIWPGVYSEWDWHVVQAHSSDHLIEGTPPAYATFAGDAGDLTCGGLAFEGPDTLLRHGANPAIYTPLVFKSGASICHWGENMANGAVLELTTPLGTARRRWAPVDLGALTDIGYKFISADAGQYLGSDTTGCAAASVTPGASGPFKNGLELLLTAGLLALLSLHRVPARRRVTLLAAMAMLALGAPAFAELQNVVVGGSIQIRTNSMSYGDWNAIRIAPNTLTSNRTNTNMFAEERTRLSIRADFTDNVDAFIEFDSYDIWGTNFRSNYLTGVDSRPTGSVNIYQAYIEAKELWATPLKLKVGRQEIKLGSGWLVDTGGSAPYFTGRSFDAVRLTYATDLFSVDGIAAKLAERSPVEEDGDTDFYSVYGSYLDIENVTLDAYWMFVRDAACLYTNLEMHTFGLRGAGTIDAFDFDAEVAYQLTDAESLESVDSFAGTLEAGYTLDTRWTPRFFVGGAYFDGGKDGAFDRLFSDARYSTILDGGVFEGTKLTGFWTASAGASVMPMDNLKLQLNAAYLSSVGNDVDAKELGWELGVSAVYHYTQDWVSRFGYSHLFAANDLDSSGSLMWSGFDAGKVVVLDDVNYFYFETKVSF